MSRPVLKFNYIPRIRRAVEETMPEATEACAEELRDLLQRVLDEGSAGIRSDTYALARSLYVKATGRDDYSQALEAARNAFTTNPSRHHDDETPEEREKLFERLKADSEPLPETPRHVSVAAVATMLAYGNKWEFEQSWMETPAVAWAMERVGAIYAERLKRAAFS